jgi:hypothetical protein
MWIQAATEIVPECPTELTLTDPASGTALFAIPRAKTSKLLVPVGDGDNYEKALYDLIQKKGYLADDKLLTTMTWRKRFLPHGTDGFTLIVLTDEHEEIDLVTDGCTGTEELARLHGIPLLLS